MNKGFTVMAFATLLSLSLSAECKPGYRVATVLKVFSQDFSAGPPTRRARPADEAGAAEQHGTASARTAILRAGGRRYEYRMLPGSASKQPPLVVGQELCLGGENGHIHLMTREGEILPGVVRPIPALPRTTQ